VGQPYEQADQQWELPELDPELRARLKAEIRRWGRVLVPLVVDEHDQIIDGKIRKQIAEELGIKDIPRISIRGLSENEKQDLRVILNICRRQLSREQVRQWIAWELVRHPHHSDRMVASTIGVSPSTVGKVRATVQVGHSDARLGVDGKYRNAVVHTETERQRKQAQEILQGLGEPPATAYLSMRKLRRLRYEQERAEMIAAAKPVSLRDFVIHACDFRKVGNRIPDHSVDLAICDPRWDQWQTLAVSLGQTLARILRPNAVACVYTGTIWEDEWNDRLKKSLTKEWRVIAVHKLPGSIMYSGAIRHRYTSILVYRNQPTGVLPTTLPLHDVLESQGYEKDHHLWQQPVQESAILIKSLSKPNDLICDLTSGSGTVAVATAAVGQGRRFVGCEIDPQLAAAGLSRVAEILMQRGCSTAETGVYASYVGNNDLLMERATRLYLKDGDRVADVTWGKGVFWRQVDISRFDFHRSDLLTCPEAPHDFTNLPYESESFDAVVFDPPYIHHPGELTNYRNSETTPGYYHDEIIDLYRKGMTQARRILKPGGYLFVKCMDEVESGVQRRGHIEVWEIAKQLGLSDQDMFLLTQKSPPQIQHPQRHARKNCSFLWVFSKP
jgi:DNA modification methylase/ParB-like chromosome segregation protein Spo0J